MQTILSFLHASSRWVDEHMGWFLTNGNKQFQPLEGGVEGQSSDF